MRRSRRRKRKVGPLLGAGILSVIIIVVLVFMNLPEQKATDDKMKVSLHSKKAQTRILSKLYELDEEKLSAYLEGNLNGEKFESMKEGEVEEVDSVVINKENHHTANTSKRFSTPSTSNNLSHRSRKVDKGSKMSKRDHKKPTKSKEPNPPAVEEEPEEPKQEDSTPLEPKEDLNLEPDPTPADPVPNPELDPAPPEPETEPNAEPTAPSNPPKANGEN
jgi:hypothetical protein